MELSATGIPLRQIEPVLGLVVLALTAAALWPPRKAASDHAMPALSDWTTNLTGRVACLGLAGTITAEVLTGKVGVTAAPSTCPYQGWTCTSLSCTASPQCKLHSSALAHQASICRLQQHSSTLGAILTCYMPSLAGSLGLAECGDRPGQHQRV